MSARRSTTFKQAEQAYMKAIESRDPRARQGARDAARPAGGADAEVEPRTPAANNLAWMLAEEGPNQDLQRAFLLAQAAHDAAPQDPQIADTLGWVLYHLGMAQAKPGRNDEARAALQKSLELQADHPGAAEAKATLATLPAGK